MRDLVVKSEWWYLLTSRWGLRSCRDANKEHKTSKNPTFRHLLILLPLIYGMGYISAYCTEAFFHTYIVMRVFVKKNLKRIILKNRKWWSDSWLKPFIKFHSNFYTHKQINWFPKFTKMLLVVQAHWKFSFWHLISLFLVSDIILWDFYS
jgi:hypothetical protein